MLDSRPRVGSVKCSDGPIGSAQVAVNHGVPIGVESHDLPGGVDAVQYEIAQAGGCVGHTAASATVSAEKTAACAGNATACSSNAAGFAEEALDLTEEAAGILVPDVKTTGIDGAVGEGSNSPADTRNQARGCVHARSVIGDDCAIGREHKTVAHVIRVREGSGNIPSRVESIGICSLICTRAGARSVDGGICAAGGVAHKAMQHTACIHIDSGHIPGRIDGDCIGPQLLGRARARRVDGGDRTIGGAHEPMNHFIRVRVEPRNISVRIDADRKSSPATAREGCAWSVDWSCYCSIGSAHKTMADIVRVDE